MWVFLKVIRTFEIMTFITLLYVYIVVQARRREGENLISKIKTLVAATTLINIDE